VSGGRNKVKCDLPAYTLKLRGRKKKQSMQFALYMPKPAPVAPEVADKHSFWICDYSVRRNRKTVLKTAYGATWLDALTGAAEGMRRMIPSGEEQDWQTQDGIESWRIFPRLVAANGSYEDHLRMSGELAARERERQEVSEVVPVYSLKLRNKRKRQQLHFTVTMPKAVPRKVWEKSDHPYWKCTVTVEKRGKATAQDFYDDVWTGAIENAFEAMRRMIPEEEECDWETPEGLSGWIVFSKTIPISWGYAFHCKLWKMVVEEERKFVADIERRRLRSEGKQLLGKRR